jgi:branched-chain amino acid transport system substrate-binding protein
MLIVKAIEKGSSLTPADIRDSLEQIRNIVGVGGLYDYAPDDHGGIDLNGFEIVRVSRGKFKIVK